MGGAANCVDVDEDLYGGFVSHTDRGRLQRLRELTPEQLAAKRTGFDDARLEEIVFRYRARNFPDTLSGDERARWEQHRAARHAQCRQLPQDLRPGHRFPEHHAAPGRFAARAAATAAGSARWGIWPKGSITASTPSSSGAARCIQAGSNTRSNRQPR